MGTIQAQAVLTTNATPVLPTPAASVPPAQGAATVTSASPPIVTPLPACAPVILKGITALGDSVLVGAYERLAERLGEDLYVSAALNRLPEQIPAILRTRREAGQLGDIVIIHTGNNGYVIEEEFDLIMAELKETRAVFFINVRVPRPWERPSNRALAAGVERFENATLIDWYETSAGHPEYLTGDGVHLTPVGRTAFAAMVTREVEATKERWSKTIECERGVRALPW
jgi:lysophospholipase L1-like esterase